MTKVQRYGENLMDLVDTEDTNINDSDSARKYLLDSKEWMKKIVIERLIQFGCAENADKIQPISLKVIASRYTSGELSPSIN